MAADMTAEQALAVLREIGSDFGIRHFTYFGRRLKPYDMKNVVMTTYCANWQNRYFEMSYHRIDPVILQAIGGFLPVDWSIIPKSSKDIKQFFGEASEMGVCAQGLSIPIRDENGDCAIFSVNSDMRLSDWTLYQPKIIPDITYLAHLFHKHVRASAPLANVEFAKLTRRESDVLQWAAQGKTNWETGQILSLTEGTVAFYLRNICYKLGVSNKTQAVAVAIQKNLISIDQRHDEDECVLAMGL
jgi:DNA-binding CsgD family transcriptional regulator